MDDLPGDEEDTVVGIAASRRTPYVVAAVERAREQRPRCTSRARRAVRIPVDVAICPLVGPEVLMGSTRA